MTTCMLMCSVFWFRCHCVDILCVFPTTAEEEKRSSCVRGGAVGRSWRRVELSVPVLHYVPDVAVCGAATCSYILRWRLQICLPVDVQHADVRRENTNR